MPLGTTLEQLITIGSMVGIVQKDKNARSQTGLNAGCRPGASEPRLPLG